MKREYPCIDIDIAKIIHNIREIKSICEGEHIDIGAVSKVVCAQRPIVEAFLKAGISLVADSRMMNLKQLQSLNCTKLLLRIPMQNEVDDVVQYCDISLNSEFSTVRKLSEAAARFNTVHNIILMVDVGDLREGILVKDVVSTVEKILQLDHIRLVGLGTNVTCYGAVIPDEQNLGILVELKKTIEERFSISLPIVSGGNSSSLYMVMNHTIPKGINQLRIGEAILLGRETSYGRPIPNCYNDAFIIKGQIVELKEKPTVPVGNIGMDAFGRKPHYEDKGIRKRAIVAVGKQDIKVDGLTPLDENISIFGASSDHLLLDVTDCKKEIAIGDVVEFKVDYGCLLLAMTSPYVNKYYKNEQVGVL